MPERKPKAQRSDDVADLFRVLRAMSADPDVSEPYFRIAFRISQFVKAATGWASVSDDTLCDYLPRTESKKIRGCRRKLEELGWLRTVEGARGRPTAYLFLETRAAEIETRLSQLRANREAEFLLRKSRENSGAKAAALRARIASILPGEDSPLIDPAMGGNLCSDKGETFPPLLPQRSTYKRATSTVQDGEHRAQTSAHASARADAGLHVCADCGKHATVEGRIRVGGRLQLWCEECRGDLILLDETLIGPKRNSLRPQKPVGADYANASRGE